jgi:CDP-diacylglycerol---glycerol-3-phosphate 3-phosphatidyltransferase
MSSPSKPVGFWNLPNILTLGRIGMIPIVAVMLWEKPGTFPDPNESIIACILFVIAMITDVIDGYLARKYNLGTPMGAYLDPLADKLMVATILVMLVPLGWAPAWVVGLLICREMTITGLRSIASQQGFSLAASPMGKLKTAYQSTALGMLLWHYPLVIPKVNITIDVHSCGIIMLYASVILALVSGGEYFYLYYRQTKAKASAATE